MFTQKGIGLFLGLLLFMTLASHAARMVQSKSGPLDLLRAPASPEIVCTAGSQEEMLLKSQQPEWSFLQAYCGNGWALNELITEIRSAKDQSMVLGTHTITAPLDLQRLVNILMSENSPVVETEINRDFREYLVYTIDKEATERKNHEN
jgi:hypothetical protein